MGCQAELREEKLLQSAVATGHNRPRPRPRWKATGRTDETLVFLPSVPVCLSWLLRLLVPRFPSLCCTESEDSIDGEFDAEKSLQLRLCFLFQPSVIFSHRDPMYCTLSCNRVQVQTFPTVRAAPVLTDSFSLGHDSYTHACKARPPTTVGRTSRVPSSSTLLPSPCGWFCMFT